LSKRDGRNDRAPEKQHEESFVAARNAAMSHGQSFHS